MSIQNLVKSQRDYFLSGITRDVVGRTAALRLFDRMISENVDLMAQAIEKDFKKSHFELVITETQQIRNEIKFALSHLHDWVKKRKVPTNVLNLPGTSYVYPEPFGVSLIIGAWNYPFNLTLQPAVSALAAGNTVILKPSELAENSSRAMAELVGKYFDPRVMAVCEGNSEVVSALMNEDLDKVFFTGSTAVGRIIAEKAGRKLMSCTLELGGKSPAILLPDADMGLSARKIAFSKFLNAGQTCVAPDYVLVPESLKALFLSEVKAAVASFYPGSAKTSASYCRIVNERHFKRLLGLIDREKVVLGGDYDEAERYIAPTVMADVTWRDSIMQEEIFGPILPVLTYNEASELPPLLRHCPRPLAFYVFGKNSDWIDSLISGQSYGGACVNDCLVHLANHHLPFGGVGPSGSGSYHGEFGFKAFSHERAILERPSWFEAKFIYPPYTAGRMNFIKRLLK